MMNKAIGFVLLCCAACVIPPHYEDRELPYGEDVALLERPEYIGHADKEMSFEARVVVLNSFYEGFDNDYLTAEDFTIGGYEGEYTIQSFETYRRESDNRPSSIMFVVDQSGSYENVDPYNTRLQAISKFLHDIRPPHNFTVGAATVDESLATGPLEVSSAMFGNDWRGARNFLFELSRRTGGETILADAVNKALDLLKQQSGARRELVLLVRGGADRSTTTYRQLSDKASANSIPIHIIALGNEVDAVTLGALSGETGGLFVQCSTVKQMVQAFKEFERLMHGTVEGYRLRVLFMPQQVIESGSSWLHRIEILDPYTEVPYNSVPVSIMIPS